MNKFLMGLAGFGAVLAAGALYLQHASIAELRDEIAGLRGDVQQAARQREVARREEAKSTATAAVVAPENGAADDTRAELAKLRDDIRGLKANTQEIVQFAKMATAASAAKNMDTSGVPDNITPVGALKNAGKGTPAQAVETVLWAATGGDVEALAAGVFIEPKAKQKAAEWFATLPDATRAQYGSPEKVIALMIAKDAAALNGMQVLATQEIKPDLAAVRVRMQADNGQTKDDTLAFARTPDGWRMVLPQNVVEKFAARVSGGK